MTRINVIPPERLTDQHLIAEYRELPRVLPLAEEAIGRMSVGCPFQDLAAVRARGCSLVEVTAPPAYTLGTGHVRFFYPRTGYLHKRQAAIIAECLSRGFNLAHRTAPAPIPGLDADWTPDAAAIATNLERLREKLRTAKRPYTHRGVSVPPDFY